MKHAAVVFVHGLFSSAQTWAPFHDLIASDPDLLELSVLDFEYPSPKLNFNPLRRIPDFNVLADSLQTYLETEAAEYSKIVLVSHSQGGLIVQRYLARMVMGARGGDLQRIRQVIMFACPNSGSEIFLLLRRRAILWRNPQERALRPVNESVVDAQQVVINRIVHAQDISSDRCPIPIYAYAGDRDNIVTPMSAKGVFPDTRVLPGDHSSIIQPDSLRHISYLAFKKDLLASIDSRTRAVDRSTVPSEPAPTRSNPDPLQSVASPINYRVAEAQTESSESSVIAKSNPTSRTVDFYDEITVDMRDRDGRSWEEAFRGRWLIEPDDTNRFGSDAGACYGIAQTAKGEIAVYVYHVNDRWPPHLAVYSDLDEAQKDLHLADEAIAAAASAMGQHRVIRRDF